MNKKVHYLGMDVHKESIEIAIAAEGGEVRRYGQVGGTVAALDKAIGRLKQPGVELRFVYEALRRSFADSVGQSYACFVRRPIRNRSFNKHKGSCAKS